MNGVRANGAQTLGPFVQICVSTFISHSVHESAVAAAAAAATAALGRITVSPPQGGHIKLLIS